MTTIDPDAHSGARSEDSEAASGASTLAAGAEPPAVSETRPDRVTADVILDVRPVDAAHGVIVTVTGLLRAADATSLRRTLHGELDRRPSVVVVDLSGVPSCDPAAVDALTAARNRCRREDISMHLVHLGAPAARAWLNAAGLA
jgi:anti-anti-sigma regulatory factor